MYVAGADQFDDEQVVDELRANRAQYPGEAWGKAGADLDSWTVDSGVAVTEKAARELTAFRETEARNLLPSGVRTDFQRADPKLLASDVLQNIVDGFPNVEGRRGYYMTLPGGAHLTVTRSARLETVFVGDMNTRVKDYRRVDVPPTSVSTPANRPAPGSEAEYLANKEGVKAVKLAISRVRRTAELKAEQLAA
jgi:hypothetical protein